jgi:hypothetical protein
MAEVDSKRRQEEALLFSLGLMLGGASTDEQSEKEFTSLFSGAWQ